MSYHPFRLLSVFVVTLVFALSLSLSFVLDAHGQISKTEKHYNRANRFFEYKYYKKAVRFYKKAAEKGHAEAQYELSKIFRGEYNYKSKTREQYGDVEINLSIAFMWLRKSAEQGYLKALEEISDAFYRGAWERHNMPKNYAKAAEWYPKVIDAANNNKSHSLSSVRTSYAMYRLGEIYSAGGFGVKQDCTQARSWYDKTIKFGEGLKGSNHLYEIAIKYDSGKEKNPCIKKNDKKASDLYLQALKRRSIVFIRFHAEKNLAEMYAKGRGVKKNIPMAYVLLWTASLSLANALLTKEEIIECLTEAKKLRKKLTQKQVDEGRKIYKNMINSK